MVLEKRRLWGVPGKVADHLEQVGQPVLSAWDLYVLIRQAYRDREQTIPPPRYFYRVRASLKRASVILPDKDYNTQYRILDVSDRPADEIVCLLDRFCFISHLSAIQRWGMTNRRPHELIITRPDNQTVQSLIADIIKKDIEEDPREHKSLPLPSGPFRLKNITHPAYVRSCPIRVHQSRLIGESLTDRNGFARVATIGQTFLDMLQKPTLCGGMAHVLDIWNEYAITYLDDIITAINGASSVVKCRAGHIIEERLGVHHPNLDAWHACAQRGGSSRLDPSRPYIPEWSEKWMISLNA